MQRRSFLKFLGLGSAVAVAPALGKVTEPKVFDGMAFPSTPEVSERLAEMVSPPVAMIRECMAYHIGSDTFMLRHDITDGEMTLHVDARRSSKKDAVAQRSNNLVELHKYAFRQGFDWSKIKRLPLPEGLSHALYV